MSVLLELSMFPTDHGESKSEYVSQVIALIRSSGYDYQLTPMATIIETNKMSEALELCAKCYDILDSLGCNRVFATMKFDIRNLPIIKRTFVLEGENKTFGVLYMCVQCVEHLYSCYICAWSAPNIF